MTHAVAFAGFWIRAVAKAIDWTVVAVVCFLPILLAGPSGGRSSDSVGMTFRQPTWLWLFPPVLLFFPLLYSVLFLGIFAATPGKMMCSLTVVDSSGHAIGYARATGRYLAEVVSGVLLFLGYLIAVLDNEKRALHDRICSTRVVWRSNP